MIRSGEACACRAHEIGEIARRPSQPNSTRLPRLPAPKALYSTVCRLNRSHNLSYGSIAYFMGRFSRLVAGAQCRRAVRAIFIPGRFPPSQLGVFTNGRGRRLHAIEDSPHGK